MSDLQRRRSLKPDVTTALASFGHSICLEVNSLNVRFGSFAIGPLSAVPINVRWHSNSDRMLRGGEKTQCANRVIRCNAEK